MRLGRLHWRGSQGRGGRKKSIDCVMKYLHGFVMEGISILEECLHAAVQILDTCLEGEWDEFIDFLSPTRYELCPSHLDFVAVDDERFSIQVDTHFPVL